jgi:signal transduction histidine kinase
MFFFSNSKKIWTTYAIILAILAAALGWFSYTTVRLDRQVESNRRQIELAERQAIQQERINYALFRMDWLLTPLVAQEAARNHWMYEALIPTEGGEKWANSQDGSRQSLEQNQLVQSQAELSQSESQPSYRVQRTSPSGTGPEAAKFQSQVSEPRTVTSPLMMRPSPFVKLHFQVDENNHFSSPQVPSDETFQMACSQGLITDKDRDFNRMRLNEISCDLLFQPLLAACSEQNLPEIVGVETVWATRLGEDQLSFEASQSRQIEQQAELIDTSLKGSTKLDVVQERARSLPPTKGGKLTDYGNRAATANQVALSQRAMNLTRVPTDAPVKQRVVEGVMRAIWFHDKLLLARRVQRENKSYIQCCWLDWDAIKKSLLAEIVDIVPNADLIPRKSEAEVEFHRALATLPVDLRVIPLVAEGKGKDGLVSTKSTDPLDSKANTFANAEMELADLSSQQAWLSPASIRSLGVAWGGFVLAALSTAWLIAGVIQLSERRSAFASAVTHELRTPLTTFRLYSEMLDGEMVKDPEQRKAYTKGLVAEADRLSRLVENVLQFSRLERKLYPFRMGSIAALELLNDVLQRCRPRLASADLDCETSFAKELADVQIVTSPDLVEQIVFNLIDNACKYAANGMHGKIRFEAELEKRWLVLRVRDYGPGIDGKMIRRLFRPFARSSDETAGTASGVGLGLCLSKQLAKQIGGRLDYQPADPGCKFEVRLPRSL